MNVNCNVIKDLLPMYIDGLLSEDSVNLVEKHLSTCKECTTILGVMKEETNTINKFDIEKSIRSKKPFKKLNNRMKLISIMLIIVSVLTGVILISNPNGAFGPSAILARWTVDRFLTLVEEKKYDEAFRYVYYTDGPSDISPKISYNEAKALWIERFKQFDAYSGESIITHKGIYTRLDDGYLIGEVDIKVESAVATDYISCGIWFARRDGKWLIGDFYTGVEQYTFQIVLSGSLTEEDRKQNYLGKN